MTGRDRKIFVALAFLAATIAITAQLLGVPLGTPPPS